MEWNIDTVAHVIEIAVAPVFLLAGISGLLVVLTNRLARAIDRSRSLQAAENDAMSDEYRGIFKRELQLLVRRGQAINLAISLATFSALLVCLVIITLFYGSLTQLNVSLAVAGLFMVTMVLLSLAFVCFLVEIYIAAVSLRTLMTSTDRYRRNPRQN